MGNLLRYLLKNYAFVLFLALEGVALSLVFSHNSYQRSKYLNSANRLSGTVYSKYNSFVSYFHLARENKKLSEENARLRTVIENFPGMIIPRDSILQEWNVKDTIFSFTPATVINNSVNKPFNYITLNKGSEHGIKPDQGIISGKGIVGVITHVSESYSVGLSVLNRRWSISAMLEDSGIFGSLVWSGMNHQIANLAEIPLHVEITPGDTVVTSGYSSIFPRGILIGTIEKVTRPEGENYYTIEVKLSPDFKKLEHVEVIGNFHRSEIIELEKKTENDPVAN